MMSSVRLMMYFFCALICRRVRNSLRYNYSGKQSKLSHVKAAQTHTFCDAVAVAVEDEQKEIY